MSDCEDGGNSSTKPNKNRTGEKKTFKVIDNIYKKTKAKKKRKKKLKTSLK
jgi:hypothetical protein